MQGRPNARVLYKLPCVTVFQTWPPTAPTTMPSTAPPTQLPAPPTRNHFDAYGSDDDSSDDSTNVADSLPAPPVPVQAVQSPAPRIPLPRSVASSGTSLPKPQARGPLEDASGAPRLPRFVE